jgi:hypothetical protein
MFCFVTSWEHDYILKTPYRAMAASCRTRACLRRVSFEDIRCVGLNASCMTPKFCLVDFEPPTSSLISFQSNHGHYITTHRTTVITHGKSC